MSAAKILVVDNELTVRKLVSSVLKEMGYDVDAVPDGTTAIDKMKSQTYQVVLTDYQMPQMNGLDLLRYIKATVTPPPLMIMFTGKPKAAMHEKARDIGSFIYLHKPINFNTLLRSIKAGLGKSPEPANKTLTEGKIAQKNKSPTVPGKIRPVTKKITGREVVPPYPAIVIASSTGGPNALYKILENLPKDLPAPIMIVQHGPENMFVPLSRQLQNKTDMRICLGESDIVPKPGVVYLAPGDVHMEIDPLKLKIQLKNGPKINSVRPAADPLFATAAEGFHKYCLGAVITGLGRDGSRGAYSIIEHGGQVVVQDPGEAVADRMPLSVIESGISCNIMTLERIAGFMRQKISKLADEIRSKRSGSSPKNK